MHAAVVVAALAWAVPAALAAIQSVVEGTDVGWRYFSDATVYARYVIAIAVMLATERSADGRLDLLVGQFRRAGLVEPGYDAEYKAALQRADRQSSSTIAESVILLGAFAMAQIGVGSAIETAGATWEGALVDESKVLSWPGLAAAFFSTPLFLFLGFRWVWRFVVWSLLLFHFSRLPLRLTPMHPDRSAGLGFLSIYPSIFTGFVFSLSCVMAATTLKQMQFGDIPREELASMLLGWIVFMVVLFLGPLVVFVHKLRTIRDDALLEYGRLANRHHLAFDRSWIASDRDGEELLGSPDPSSVSDLNAGVQIVHEMRIFPVDRFALMQLAAAIGVPLLAVVLARVPLIDIAARLGLGLL